MKQNIYQNLKLDSQRETQLIVMSNVLLEDAKANQKLTM